MVEKVLINKMRSNSRASIAKLARKLDCPTTSLYYKFDAINKKYVKKHVSLVDFDALDFKRIMFFINTSKKNLSLVKNNISVNNIYRHYGGFIIECVFISKKEEIEFIELLLRNDISYDFSPVLEIIKQEELML